MRRIRFSLSVVFLAGLLPILALAGGTPISGGSQTLQPLVMQQGSTSSTAFGDYVSDTGGLNTYYSFWVEVPTGVGSLQINIYDRDNGVGGGGEAADGRDRARSGFNSSAQYTVRNPSGTVVANQTYAAAGGCDDVWCNIGTFSQTNPAAGHWEVRVNMNSSVTGGDDINGYGIRAHDGTPGAGGTELNVYAESFFTFGVNNTGDSRNYTLYPYVTRGCELFTADFDWDSNATSGNGGTAPYGSLNLVSRDGALNHTNASMSANNTWRNETVSGWRSDTASTGYGLFTNTVNISWYATGNYGVVYYRNDAAAVPPPSAQPQANTYRIYLPNDAGTAPSKTYVEQLLTYSSGPNPPTMGNLSRYTVTVRVVNPEAQAITFGAGSPNRYVTANIPGSQVLYGGDFQSSQGSVVSQPSVGGSGNVVWNPGTVAAGATAAMSYRLNVTPTVASGRIPLTATPGSGNGTRAVFRDNTGSTTQARANFTFGPICELAVTVGGSPTVATVVEPRAWRAAGGTVLAWDTASEIGTAGFEVQRENTLGQWQTVGTVNGNHLSSEQGARYQLLDVSAPQNDKLNYRIIEHEMQGGKIVNGPFLLDVQSAGNEPTAVSSLTPGFAEAQESSPEEAQRIAIQRSEANGNQLTGLAGYQWIKVSEAGMYRIPATQLAARFGISSSEASSRLAGGDFALSLNGISIPWFDVNGGLAFYGENLATSLDSQTRYLLALNAGLSDIPGSWSKQGDSLLSNANTEGNSRGSESATQFVHQAYFSKDEFAAVGLPQNSTDDYWYWASVAAGNSNASNATLPFELTDVISDGGARLVVDLQGASNSNVPGEHLVSVSVNGVSVGEARWTGLSKKSVALDIPQGVLVSGANELSISALLADGATTNAVFVNDFTVTYQRELLATGDALEFNIPVGFTATVNDFVSSNIQVYDLTSVRSPRPVSADVAEQGDLFSVTLNGESGKSGAPDSVREEARQPGGGVNVPNDAEEFQPGARYLAVSDLGYQSVAGFDPVAALEPADLGDGADWLVIAPDLLMDGANALAEFRAEDGMQAVAVSAEAIYAAFSGGMTDPEAIRDFLQYTQSNWSPAPRYVLLAGRGTYDHRNLEGQGDHLLTPMLTATPTGIAVTDPRFADFDDLGLPTIAIGRLPAVNNQELIVYRDKLRIHERTRVVQRAAVAMAADNFDPQAGNFAGLLDSMGDLVKDGYAIETASLDVMTRDQANEALLASLQEGVSWLNLVGHSGLNQFTHENVFDLDDVDALTNTTQLPVMTAFSCIVNRSDIPGFSSLGEHAVLGTSAGAIASWAPSWVLPHAYSERMGIHFAQALANAQNLRIGDVILAASLAYHQDLEGNADEIARSLPLIYNLFGDPAAQTKY